MTAVDKWRDFRSLYGKFSRPVALSAGASGINLGCGARPLRGFVNVDKYPGRGVDALVDLEEPLPFRSESFDVVVLDNVLEHIAKSAQLLAECRRISRTGGFVVIDVPYFRSAGAFIDPTHRNFYTLRSMRYFVPGTYESQRYVYFPQLFQSVDVVVNPGERSSAGLIASFVASRRPEWFEDSMLSPFLRLRSIRFVLRV